MVERHIREQGQKLQLIQKPTPTLQSLIDLETLLRHKFAQRERSVCFVNKQWPPHTSHQ